MCRALSHQSELESFPALEWQDVAPRLQPRIPLGARTSHGIAGRRRAHSRTMLACLRMPKATISSACWSPPTPCAASWPEIIVTYVVNRNINFTNICFVGCKFCAFSRGPRESDTYFLNPEQVAQKAVQAWKIGATEVCIQGGLPHGLPPFYYRDILRAVKQVIPGMHIHAFSPMEIMYGVELTGMPLADYLSMLRDNGLDTLPAPPPKFSTTKFASCSRATNFPPSNGRRSFAPRIGAAFAARPH